VVAETGEKVAITLLACDIVVVQAPVPEQIPVQPANVKFVFGTAVRVTDVPELNPYEQVAPQEMPAGDEVIVPFPSLVTERV
jgi:hypothetical protein